VADYEKLVGESVNEVAGNHDFETPAGQVSSNSAILQLSHA